MTELSLELKQGLPADVAAEICILGAILQDNGKLDQLADLPEAAFSLDSHRKILNTQRALYAEGKDVELLSLYGRLRERKWADTVGGHAYLTYLTQGISRRTSIAEAIRIVREKWQLRQVISICQNYATRAADQSEESAQEIVVRADRELLEVIADDRNDWPNIEVQTHNELKVFSTQRSGKLVMGYPYGIHSLDKQIIGLVPKEMTVLGGRPQQGKSWIVAQLVTKHCPNGVPAHVFSYEMSSGQFLRRLWSIVSGVAYHKLRNPEPGNLTDEENKSVNAAALLISGWPLVIDDSSSLTTEQLCARARISKRKQGTVIVCVDYLQRMRFDKQREQRHLDVAAACVAMAGLAKDEGFALLLLSALTEKGGDRNTALTLQDFRASGDIAYEASTALIIHREIDPATEQPRELGEIIICKGRSDRGGIAKVRFRNCQFEDA